MHVLIPAGGRGLRLRPLTIDCPKPLLPLGDRPILSHIVDRIPFDYPIVVLVTPELEPCFREWQRSLPLGRDVRIFVERPRPQGLGGPVVALGDCLSEFGIQDDLIIMMGDSVPPFHTEEFLVSQDPSALRLAAYEVADLRDARRFGVLEIGPDESAVSFEEKPAHPRSRWVFTGCLFIPRHWSTLLTHLPEGALPQMGHLVCRALEFEARVEVFRVTGTWHDIGTFESYLEAHRAFATNGGVAALTSSGNHLEGVVYVHPTAKVAHSRLRNCIIFDDARVEGADLQNCVIQARVRVADRIIRDKLLALEAEYALREGVTS